MAIPHLPERPAWTCRDCKLPWPCVPGRERLVAESRDHLALMLYLASLFFEACADLPLATAGPLYGRFIGWARGVKVG